MTRQMVILSIIAFCVSTFTVSAYAAPLLDDVPSDHWAQNAVASLAANGIMEGYPDGFFRGDRAMTRNEMAVVLARLLAKNDREHAAFATKADVDDMRKLSSLLEDELESQGVHISDLEKDLKTLRMRLNRE